MRSIEPNERPYFEPLLLPPSAHSDGAVVVSVTVSLPTRRRTSRNCSACMPPAYGAKHGPRLFDSARPATRQADSNQVRMQAKWLVQKFTRPPGRFGWESQRSYSPRDRFSTLAN